MTMTTGVFFIIVCFFLWRGYQKGFASSLAQILSLVVAYPTAILFTTPLANLLFKHTSLTGMLVYFIAGSALFIAVSLLFTSLIKVIARAVPEHRFSARRAKLGGAVLGVLLGCALGLMAVYGITLAEKVKARDQDSAIFSQQKSLSAESFIESWAKQWISSLAATAVEFILQDKTAADISKTFILNPQKTLGHLHSLSQDGELETLMSRAKIQALLKNGDSHALLQDGQFQQLMNSDDIQAILVNSEDTKDGKTSQQVAAEKMVAVWQRSDAIKHDPRVVAIINDAEFQQQINSNNKLALMMNPKLKQLTDIIFSNDYYRDDDSKPEKK